MCHELVTATVFPQYDTCMIFDLLKGFILKGLGNPNRTSYMFIAFCLAVGFFSQGFIDFF